MCTHTIIHHTPCLCISTRTTKPCTQSDGAGYRGSVCPAFEHVKLFISASDSARCFCHPEAGEGGDLNEVSIIGGGSPKCNGGLDVGENAGVIKETVKKLDGMSGKGNNFLESTRDMIDSLIRTDRSPQSKIFELIDHSTTKAELYPQTPPKRNLSETRTDIRDSTGAEITSQSSIYSSSNSSSNLHNHDSPHKHASQSSSSSSDPFYIKTPKDSSVSSAPQDPFPQDEDVIYGGTSLLGVPIDGTKWNWNGKQWIGMRFVHVHSSKEEMDSELVQMRMTK